MLKWLWLSLAVLMLDQATKLWVAASMRLYESIEVMPFFRLTYVHNQGAAFSFLSEAGGWQRWFFVLLTVGVGIGIAVWLSRLPAAARLQAAALALILGGAMGNLIDRLAYGYVIDFLDVYYESWHWPAFNVADSAITLGVALMLIDSFRPAPARVDDGA